MKQGKYYNNERSYPANTLNKNLKIINKIKKCTCEPVHYKNMICYATQNAIVYFLNDKTLEVVKEIQLQKTKPLTGKKIQVNSIYLFAHEEFLIIQAGKYLLKYDITDESLLPLITNDEISALSSAISIKEYLYCLEYEDEDQTLQQIDLASGKMSAIRNLPEAPQFYVASGEKIVYHDQTDIVCYDIAQKKELWRTQVENLGDYFDEMSESQEAGLITAEVFIAQNYVVLSVEKQKIVNLDITTGKIKWVVSIEDQDIPRLTYADGQDHFFYMANNLGQVDLQTGKIIKKYELEAKLEEKELAPGPLGISEKYFYISSAYNTPGLIVVNRQTGKIEEVHPLEGHSFMQPAIIGDYLVVLDHGGNLYFFSSGKDK